MITIDFNKLQFNLLHSYTSLGISTGGVKYKILSNGDLLIAGTASPAIPQPNTKVIILDGKNNYKVKQILFSGLSVSALISGLSPDGTRCYIVPGASYPSVLGDIPVTQYSAKEIGTQSGNIFTWRTNNDKNYLVVSQIAGYGETLTVPALYGGGDGKGAKFFSSYLFVEETQNMYIYLPVRFYTTIAGLNDHNDIGFCKSVYGGIQLTAPDLSTYPKQLYDFCLKAIGVAKPWIRSSSFYFGTEAMSFDLRDLIASQDNSYFMSISADYSPIASIDTFSSNLYEGFNSGYVFCVTVYTCKDSLIKLADFTLVLPGSITLSQISFFWSKNNEIMYALKSKSGNTYEVRKITTSLDESPLFPTMNQGAYDSYIIPERHYLFDDIIMHITSNNNNEILYNYKTQEYINVPYTASGVGFFNGQSTECFILGKVGNGAEGFYMSALPQPDMGLVVACTKSDGTVTHRRLTKDADSDADKWTEEQILAEAGTSNQYAHIFRLNEPYLMGMAVTGSNKVLILNYNFEVTGSVELGDTGEMIQCAAEPDNTVVQYFLNDNNEIENKSAVFNPWLDLVWQNEHSRFTLRPVTNFGIKGFPDIGGYGFYEQERLNQQEITIKAPINLTSELPLPVINYISQTDTAIVYSLEMYYTHYRFQFKQGDFVTDFITTTQQGEFEKPFDMVGEYSLTVIGYSNEIQEFSNVLHYPETIEITQRTDQPVNCIADTFKDIYNQLETLFTGKENKLIAGLNISLDRTPVNTIVSTTGGGSSKGAANMQLLTAKTNLTSVDNQAQLANAEIMPINIENTIKTINLEWKPILLTPL